MLSGSRPTMAILAYRFAAGFPALAFAALFGTLIAASPALGQSAETLIATVIDNTGLSGDLVKRMEAHRRLVSRGKKSPDLVVPLIVTELEKPHRYDNGVLQQRIALIEVLRDIAVPAEAAVPALTAILEDQDRRLEWLHFAIGGALMAIGTPEADAVRHADDLRRLEDWRDKASSADIAAAVEWHDFSIRQQLRRHDLAEKLIEAAVLPLLVLGPEARRTAPTLLRAYADPRAGAELRSLLERTLAAMGVADTAAASAALAPPPGPLEEIIADLHRDNDQIRGFAITELVRAAPPERAVDVLIELLRDGKSPGAAANALREIGEPAARALPDLLPHMTDRRDGANIVQAVGALGVGQPSAVAALRAVLADPLSPNRGLAASALGRLEAGEAVPELIAALNAREKYTRILAANALGRIGAPAAEDAVPRLVVLLEDRDRDIQIAAAEALAKLGPAAAPAAPALTALLQSSDDRVKAAARRALAGSGVEAAVAALAADAGRYRAADKREADRLLLGGDDAAVGRLFRRLPEERSTQLARLLLSDERALVSYLASGVLIRAGRAEETLPALAEIIVSGKVEAELNGRMGYDWVHSDQPEKTEGMFGRLADYLEAHTADYGPEEQARANNYLRAMGR